MDFTLILVGLLSITSTDCIAQSVGLSAAEFFDESEANLRLIAANVEKNKRNACALLSTCGGVGNCSRQDCSYDVLDLPDYSCQSVSENSYCSTSATCKWRNFNFKKSTISAAPTTDISSNETTTVICAQRALDEVFPNVSNPINNNQVYFGSVDGTTRTYPGADEYPCKDFDPRVRPWYLQSLYVKKVVTVVIDTGFSMGEPLTAGDDASQNPLSSAQNLTTSLMNTLSGSDFINIMVYNASSANLLAPNPVAVNDSNSDTYPPSHPEFDALTASLMSVAVGTANAGPSNLSLAMDTAISDVSPFQSEFVKVVIVLTDGALGDPTSPMWESLQSAGVKLFVYKFEDPDSLDTSIITDQQQVCNIGGSYESFPMNRRQNPLFALQSYYDFVASTHTKMNSSVVYGYVYPDFVQADSEIFTISLPVYDSNGVLLGVVGLDIHRSDVRNRLGISDTDFEAETSRRLIIYTFNATRDLVLDSTTCSNQTTAVTSVSSGSCGSDIAIPSNGGLCEANAQGRSIAEFSCCRDCVAGEKSKEPYIVGASVGAVLALAVVIGGIVVARVVALKRRPPESEFPPDFSGNNSENQPVNSSGPPLDEAERNNLVHAGEINHHRRNFTEN